MRSLPPRTAALALAAVLVAPVVACDGVEQARSCERYVACVRALDVTINRETNVERFDAGGACWGSEEGALLCERACERGLAWQERQAGAPAECRP